MTLIVPRDCQFLVGKNIKTTQNYCRCGGDQRPAISESTNLERIYASRPNSAFSVLPTSLIGDMIVTCFPGCDLQGDLLGTLRIVFLTPAPLRRGEGSATRLFPCGVRAPRGDLAMLPTTPICSSLRFLTVATRSRRRSARSIPRPCLGCVAPPGARASFVRCTLGFADILPVVCWGRSWLSNQLGVNCSPCDFGRFPFEMPQANLCATITAASITPLDRMPFLGSTAQHGWQGECYKIRQPEKGAPKPQKSVLQGVFRGRFKTVHTLRLPSCVTWECALDCVRHCLFYMYPT